MKLNDRTLTAITAICLAVGVGVAGLLIPSGPQSTADRYAGLEPALITAPTSQSSTIILPLNTSEIKHPVLSDLVKITDLQAKPQHIFAALLPRDPAQPTARHNAGIVTSLPSDACAITLTAKVKPAARVDLQLSAPCHPNSIATIEHAGLRFREKLNAKGKLFVTVPAFAEFSEFNITLRGGQQASISTYIAGLSRLNRAGISYEGNTKRTLRAHSSGLAAGHVSANHPRSYALALQDGGGFLTVLGDPNLPNAMVSQIYTHLSTGRDEPKLVHLEIQTPQNATNCGNSNLINTARHNPQMGKSHKRIRIKNADCDSANPSLVLKNSLKDMRMAQN